MANQNIGTPRFYIDYLNYNKAIGNTLLVNDPTKRYWSSHVGLDANGIYYNVTDDEGKVWVSPEFNNTMPLPDISDENSKLFVGCIGNNASSVVYTGNTTGIGLQLDFKIADSIGNSTYYTNAEIVNYPGEVSSGETGSPPDFDGFTIVRKTELTSLIDINALRTRFFFDWIGEEGLTSTRYLSPSLYIKSVILGVYYDMPHSPELSLTMSHEYEGIKKQETAGGSTLGYVNYYKPPDWGDLQAWQLSGWDRKYSGRRVWDLAFNHLSDSDIEPYNYHIDSSSGHSDWNEDGNWFTNVIHYTNGGQLPFIFCPDPNIGYNSSTWTVPEFAICRFDMKTFKREQVANGIYNIKVKIKESW